MEVADRALDVPAALLGMIAIVAGLGWMTYFAPPLGDRLFPVLMPVGFLGAVAQIGWLLIFGVNETRWREQAGAARASSS